MTREHDHRHTLAHEAMATAFKLTVLHADPVYARQAAAAAFAELERIEGRLSRFVETSDISRINRLGRGQATVVQLDTFDCLEIAMDVHRQTQGAFDVAYSHRRCLSPPPGEPQFELNAEDHTVRVLADGVRLDLGGIGKGFALDRMAALLADWEIDTALLAASTSTLLALAAPRAGPGKRGQSPFAGTARDQPAVGARLRTNGDCPLFPAGWAITFGPEHDLRRERLVHRALSGSGTAVKGSHIIDPRTGRPVPERLRAWAGAPTAALADALSTAFMVMTETEIRGYCNRHPDVSAHVLPSAEATVYSISPRATASSEAVPEQTSEVSKTPEVS